jgi:hypothetical protein
MIIVNRQPDLLEIILALRPSRRLACLLYRRQQQRYQDRDDGDDNQQFNQRKPAHAGFRSSDHETTPTEKQETPIDNVSTGTPHSERGWLLDQAHGP